MMPRLVPVAACLALLGCSADHASGALESNASSSSAITQVTSFGTNPGNLKMYDYVPAGMPAHAPLVVAMHGCTQSASAYVNAGWNELADLEKFYVVYPEQQQANNQNLCFNWYDTTNTSRGSGESLSIKQMVDAMKASYSVDDQQVFVTGLSAGGAMTAVLLAAYPDVFRAGAVMAGLPYRCATTTSDAYTCMSPGKDETAQQWGDLVRAAVSSYGGPYPRVSIWQGSSDAIVSTSNLTALVRQWTNVNGIADVATSTSTVSGASHAEYQDTKGHALVESYMVPNMGHGTALEVGFAPAGGCGTAGAYILDAGICSTYYAWLFFHGGALPAPVDAGADAQPPPPPPPVDAGPLCQQFQDANYNHVLAGRATRCGVGGSYVCAVGSGTQFGLWTMMQSWLRETAPGYFEPGQCP